MQITEGLHDSRKIHILSVILLSSCALMFQTGTAITNGNYTSMETIFNYRITNLSAKFKTEGKGIAKEDSRKGLHSISLILCEDCLWCTSIILPERNIVNCPSCCGNALEVIPVSSD